MGEGVIDEQGDASGEGQPGEDEQGDAVGEIPGLPGGTLEEVVVAVEAVPLGAVRRLLGSGVIADVEEGMLAQAHDPGEEQAAVGVEEGWVKAGARVSTQQSSEGIISHTGGAPCCWPGNLQRRSFFSRFHRPLMCLRTPECLLKSANVQVSKCRLSPGWW